ncbi:MAG: hypothetical protein EA359_10775 [Balneolaceae bacterium]|nr:MAG: hypothetical protein EA359_10775 [Balneolaceae bacterium]
MSSKKNVGERPSEYIRLEAELLSGLSIPEPDSSPLDSAGATGMILILAPMPAAAKEIAEELQNGLGSSVTVSWGESPPVSDLFSETKQADLILYKPLQGNSGTSPGVQKNNPCKTLYRYNNIVLLQRKGSNAAVRIQNSGRAAHLLKAINQLSKS